MSLEPILPRIYRHPGASFSIWTLYRPGRYPGQFAVQRRTIRLGKLAGEPELVHIGYDIDHARLAIPIEADTCLHRSPDDDPVIIESWIKGGPDP